MSSFALQYGIYGQKYDFDTGFVLQWFARIWFK